MITYTQIYYICKSIKKTRIYEFFLNLQFLGVITPSPRPLRGGWSATLPNRIFWSNSTTWLSPLNFDTLCKSQPCILTYYSLQTIFAVRSNVAVRGDSSPCSRCLWKTCTTGTNRHLKRDTTRTAKFRSMVGTYDKIKVRKLYSHCMRIQ